MGVLEDLARKREQESAGTGLDVREATQQAERQRSILQDLERQRKESVMIGPPDPAQAGAPVQRPARPPEFSLSRTVAGGLVRGVSSFVGMPGDIMDLTEAGLAALGVPDPLKGLPEEALAKVRPFLPGQLNISAKINKIVDDAMLGLGMDITPTTQKEEAAQRIIQEITGSQLSLGTIRAISRTARTVPAFKAALQELGFSAASGAAAAGARKIVPDSALTEIGAQLSPEAAVFAYNLLRSVSGRIPFTASNLRRKAIRALRRTSTDVEDLEPNLRHTLEIQQAIEATGKPYTPSLAEATGSRGMISVQAGFEAKGAGPGDFSRYRRAQNIDSATDALHEAFQRGDVSATERAMRYDIGRAEQRVTRATESAAARKVRAQTRIDARLNRAQDMLGDAISQFGSDRPGAAARLKTINNLARKSYVQARNAFRSESARKFENIDPAGAIGGPIDEAVTMVQRIEQAAVDQFDEEHIPRSVRNFLRTIKKRAMQARGDIPRQSLTQRQIAAMPDSQLELQEFIRRKGGINLSNETDMRGELEALIRNRETGTTGLFRTEGGLTAQEMAEAAAESGFIAGADKYELLDAIRASRKSGKVYSAQNSDIFSEPELFDPAVQDAINRGAVSQDELLAVDVTLNDLQRARSNALMESRQLSGPNAAPRQRLLNQYIEVLDQKMENLATTSGNMQALDDLKEARKFFRENVGKFRAGAGADILAMQNGEYRVKNAQVLRKVLNSDEDISRFANSVGDADAKAMLQEYLDNEVYLRAVGKNKSGRPAINQRQLRSFLTDREGVFQRYPDLRPRYAQLDRVEEVVQRVESTGPQLTARATQRLKEDRGIAEAMEALQENPSRRYLEAPRGERDITIEMATERVMRTSNPNQRIIRTINSMPEDPAFGEGLMRAVWDRFITQESRRGVERTASGLPNITPRNINNFIEKYRPSLERVYGKEHVKNLDKFKEGLIIARRAERIPMRPGSETAELWQTNLSAIQPVIDVASFTAGPFTGFLIRHASRRVRSAIASLTRAEVESVMNEMLFDPDISKTFALIRDGESVRVLPRLRAHLTMLGAGSRLEERQPESTP